MEQDKIDRRRLVRVKMPFTIHLHFEGKEPISTYTEDISEEGVKIVIKQKLKVEDTAKIDIYVLPVPLQCQGKIVWVCKKKSDNFKKIRFYETGIKLSGINPENRKILKARLKETKLSASDT